MPVVGVHGNITRARGLPFEHLFGGLKALVVKTDSNFGTWLLITLSEMLCSTCQGMVMNEVKTHFWSRHMGDCHPDTEENAVSATRGRRCGMQQLRRRAWTSQGIIMPIGSGDMGNAPHLVLRLYLHPTWTLHTSGEKDVASRCTKHNGNGISLTWAELNCLG